MHLVLVVVSVFSIRFTEDEAQQKWRNLVAWERDFQIGVGDQREIRMTRIALLHMYDLIAPKLSTGGINQYAECRCVPDGSMWLHY